MKTHIALLFLLLSSFSCRGPDAVTPFGIELYASESGGMLSAAEVDARVGGVWFLVTNGGVVPFTIQFTDELNSWIEGGMVVLSLSGTPDCSIQAPELEHAVGHWLASRQLGDHDLGHVDIPIWGAVQRAYIDQGCIWFPPANEG